MPVIAGTFEAVGNAEEFTTAGPRLLVLDFAGGGKVEMQILLDGEWKTLREFTETFGNRFNPPPVAAKCRLSCTEYAANVFYFLG